MKTKESTFIHIPKCGGSSFVGLLKDSISISSEEKKISTHNIRKVGEINIEHVDFSTSERRFRKPQMFHESKNDAFLNQNIFMLARNPLHRLVSEFNFQFYILNGKNGNQNAGIISKLKPLPNNFESYIEFPNTQNYQCKFLLGRKLADHVKITESEFKLIINSIEKLNIHLGLTEYYTQFVAKFSNVTKQKLNSEILHRKQTPSEIKTNITDETKKKVLFFNQFDYRLYEYIKNRISNELIENQSKFKVKSTDTFIR